MKKSFITSGSGLCCKLNSLHAGKLHVDNLCEVVVFVLLLLLFILFVDLIFLCVSVCFFRFRTVGKHSSTMLPIILVIGMRI